MKFSQFLAQFRNGTLDDMLADAMRELVGSVEDFRKPGKLTITLSLTPKMEGELASAIKFALSKPKRDTVESTLFSTPEGNLLPYNPAQGDMFNKQNIKVIDHDEETGEVKSFVEGAK